MKGRKTGPGAETLAWAVACVALWPVPLLNRLHVESAAVIAFAGFFVAGWAAQRGFARGAAFGRVLRARLLRVPLAAALMTIPVAWAPNCDIAWGATYFALFVGPSVVFSTAVARVLASGGRTRFGLQVAVGAAVALAGPLYDVGLHPQFYTYNHVFGAVVGPLYDEELVWRWGLVASRGLTLAWAALLWSVASLVRSRSKGVRVGRDLRTRGAAAPVAALSCAAVAGAYLFAGPLGLNTTRGALEAAMPVELVRGPLVVHVDTAATPGTATAATPGTDPSRWTRLADFAEWQAHRLTAALGVEPSRPVDVWVYPDRETRALLTGARVTSVAPVWLRQPQVHVVLEEVEDLLPHELVHAWSREFGMPVLHASPSVGLVEGLAVALEPPGGRPSAHELVAAAELGGGADGLARRAARTLSPWGFWTGRGGVSYTVTGSFVGWLLDVYGAPAVERAYRRGSLPGSLGAAPDSLALGWAAWLDRSLSLPADAGARARARFAVPSVFERRCPHHVPRPERERRASVRAWVRGDTTEALARSDRAIALAPGDPSIIEIRTGLLVRLGRLDEARSLVDATAESLRTGAVRVAAGDLAAIRGEADEARAAWDALRRELPVSARESRAVLAGRTALAAAPEAIRLLVAGREVPSGVFATWVDSVLAATGAGAADPSALAAAGPGAADPSALAAARPRLSAGALGEWARQRLAWRSGEAYAGGDLPGAWAYADSARAACEAAGDLTGAAFMAEAARRLRWLHDRHG